MEEISYQMNNNQGQNQQEINIQGSQQAQYNQSNNQGIKLSYQMNNNRGQNLQDINIQGAQQVPYNQNKNQRIKQNHYNPENNQGIQQNYNVGQYIYDKQASQQELNMQGQGSPGERVPRNIHTPMVQPTMPRYRLFSSLPPPVMAPPIIAPTVG